jgi:hypothetical protein
MWQEIARIGIGWGAAAGLVGFWYWIMGSIGTF